MNLPLDTRADVNRALAVVACMHKAAVKADELAYVVRLEEIEDRLLSRLSRLVDAEGGEPL